MGSALFHAKRLKSTELSQVVALTDPRLCCGECEHAMGGRFKLVGTTLPPAIPRHEKKYLEKGLIYFEALTKFSYDLWPFKHFD